MYDPIPPEEYQTDSDDVVSVKSQNGVDLNDLIDQRPQIEVDGNSTLSDPGHTNEIKNEEFVDLIRSVNDQQAD